jgi:hypothetical protein
MYKTIKCLILESSLSDQLYLELVLDQIPELDVSYVNTIAEFLDAIALRPFHFCWIDSSKLEVVDLIQPSSSAIFLSGDTENFQYEEKDQPLFSSEFYFEKPFNEHHIKARIVDFIEAISINIQRNTDSISFKQPTIIYETI